MVSEKKKEEDNIDTVGETMPITAFEEIEQKPKQTYILFLKGELLGKLFTLKNGVTVIGRSAGSGIVINDNGISREHIKIKVSGKEAVIEDLGSTNGTYVNYNRISKQTLQNGDKIQISPSTVFKFIISDESEKVFHDELYLMGVMDPVTNIYNKRYFTDRLKQGFSHAVRYKTDLSILLIDIDFFKKVNDTYGHLAGDLVLVKISQILSSITRHADICARCGGEEFAAILPETNEEGAIICAERIRKKIAETPVIFEDKEIKITVSAGVAIFNEENPFENDEKFIEAADDCLYYSKEHGRNRTTSISQLKA